VGGDVGLSVGEAVGLGDGDVVGFAVGRVSSILPVGAPVGAPRDGGLPPELSSLSEELLLLLLLLLPRPPSSSLLQSLRLITTILKLSLPVACCRLPLLAVWMIWLALMTRHGVLLDAPLEDFLDFSDFSLRGVCLPLLLTLSSR
jgi:hypothetical protein